MKIEARKFTLILESLCNLAEQLGYSKDELKLKEFKSVDDGLLKSLNFTFISNTNKELNFIIPDVAK